MNAARHRRVRAIVEAALRRPDILDELDDPPDLLAEARAMLAAHDEIDPAFLSAGGSGELLDALRDGEPIGARVGRYRLERLLGRGGAGAVYAATDGANELVAIKILEHGADPEARRRFRRERKLLAALDHPGIVRYLDTGTVGGRPYLVMEYVNGVPVDRYCSTHRLSLRDRLRLFIEIGRAVQCAHQHLVVHRDLKPANLLITTDGAPRLLDFGIGKPLPGAVGITVTAAPTAGGPMTLAYASPEQIRGGVVTVATDVHALGVLLFTLLTDRHPFDLRGLAPYEQQRVICERDAPAPSALESSGRRRPPGDLDTVTARALAKDPKRRYASVQALCDDVGRFLDGRPVAARRDTRVYRASKFVRRHRIGAAAALLCAMAMVAAATISTRWAIIAGRDRDASDRALQRAEHATAFFGSLLESANPYRLGADPSVRDLLAGAEATIERDLAGQPEVEIDVRLALARTCVGLWSWDEAIGHARRAVNLLRRVGDANDPRRSDALLLLSRSLAHIGDRDCLPPAREALTLRRAVRVADERALADAECALAFARWPDHTPDAYAEAETLYRQSLARLEADAERTDDIHALTLFSYGSFLSMRRDYERAAPLIARAVSMFEQIGPRGDRYRAECLRAHAGMLEHQARYAEAEAVTRVYLEMTPPSIRDHRANRAVWQLGRLRLRQGDRDGADALLHAALIDDLVTFTDQCASSAPMGRRLQTAMSRSDGPHPYDACLEFLQSFTWRKDIVVGQFLPLAELLALRDRRAEAERLLLACRDAILKIERPDVLRRVERALQATRCISRKIQETHCDSPEPP